MGSGGQKSEQRGQPHPTVLGGKYDFHFSQMKKQCQEEDKGAELGVCLMKVRIWILRVILKSRRVVFFL